MRAALAQAQEAARLGEVPVGAVIVLDGEIIARGHNRNILGNDPSAHAEVIAMREAGDRLGNHRLLNCEMYVTLEPCAMCAGALTHARINRLVFGARDPKAGAVFSVMQALNHPALNHTMEVTEGVLVGECGGILQEFFRKKRTEGSR